MTKTSNGIAARTRQHGQPSRAFVMLWPCPKWVILAAMAMIAVFVAPTTTMAQSSAYQQGLEDRAAWEQWFASLQGDYKTGAFYWSGQRSLPNPGTCRQMNVEFYNGCVAAKARLAPTDVLRESDSEYQQGWNAYSPPVPNASAPPTPPAAPGTSARADSPNTLKKWPQHGAWQTSLNEVGGGKHQCLAVNATDEGDGNSFGIVLVVQSSQPHVVLTIFDSARKDVEAEQVTVGIDDTNFGEFDVIISKLVNGVYVDAVSLGSDFVKDSFIPALRVGSVLKITTSITDYKFRLNGFDAALEDIGACAKLADTLEGR